MQAIRERLIEEYLVGLRVRYRPPHERGRGGDGRIFAGFELWKTLQDNGG